MPNVDVKEVRNIAILSHGAAGKTSLADALLFTSGTVDLMGSVDTGNSVFMHEPEEMARPILFMCSEDASFMSGALMVVDGGYSVGLPVPGVLDAPLVPGGVR